MSLTTDIEISEAVHPTLVLHLSESLDKAGRFFLRSMLVQWSPLLEWGIEFYPGMIHSFAMPYFLYVHMFHGNLLVKSRNEHLPSYKYLLVSNLLLFIFFSNVFLQLERRKYTWQQKTMLNLNYIFFCYGVGFSYLCALKVMYYNFVHYYEWFCAVFAI